MSVFRTGVSRTDGLRTTMLAAALVLSGCGVGATVGSVVGGTVGGAVDLVVRAEGGPADLEDLR